MALNAASERKLKGVKADLVRVVQRAAELTKQPFQIVQGNRTQAEQNAIYAQGRTKPGKIVTWTKNSKHIGGNAIDFAALSGGKISWNEKLYPAVVTAFKQAAREFGIGIEAGADWKTKDWGHIQLTGKVSSPQPTPSGIGWTILDVQNSLVRHGFNPGPIDNILGPKTRQALIAFEKATGLPETGSMAEATLARLGQETPPQAIVAPRGESQWAISFLESLGWPKLVATAIVAHLMWESGGNTTIIWNAHGDKGRDGKFHSHAAPQWNDRHGRWQKYQAFAESRGAAWDNRESQLRYLDHELRTTEKTVAKQLREAPTLEDAVKVGLKFWRPSTPHLEKRLAIAKSLTA